MKPCAGERLVKKTLVDLFGGAFIVSACSQRGPGAWQPARGVHCRTKPRCTCVAGGLSRISWQGFLF